MRLICDYERIGEIIPKKIAENYKSVMGKVIRLYQIESQGYSKGFGTGIFLEILDESLEIIEKQVIIWKSFQDYEN